MAKSPIPAIGGKLARAYIVVEDDPDERLEFQLWPQDLSNQKVAEYNDFPIVARSEPVRVYSHSGPSIFNFTLMYVSSISPADDPALTDEQKKILPAQAANFLHALTYPRYKNGIAEAPPVVILIVGDYISARCITRSVNIGHGELCPWDVDTMLPMMMLGQIVLEEVNLVPPSYETIRSRNFGLGAHGQSGNV